MGDLWGPVGISWSREELGKELSRRRGSSHRSPSPGTGEEETGCRRGRCGQGARGLVKRDKGLDLSLQAVVEGEE